MNNILTPATVLDRAREIVPQVAAALGVEVIELGPLADEGVEGRTLPAFEHDGATYLLSPGSSDYDNPFTGTYNSWVATCGDGRDSDGLDVSDLTGDASVEEVLDWVAPTNITLDGTLYRVNSPE